MRTSIFLLSTLLVTAGTLRGQDLFRFDYSIENVGSINSEANDYAGALDPSRGSMYFTSFGGGSTLGKADLFISRRASDGSWSAGVNPGAPLNSAGNDGGLAIAADGETVVFTSDGRDGAGDADLYLGRLKGGVVGDITPLRAANSSRWESQPTISADGRTIVFASNRGGGEGGTDLWITTRDDAGTWNAPRNMGAPINGGDDEASPYLTPDGRTLYFSSDRDGGFGGQDIWVSTLQGEEWSQPVNLGSLINSDRDELFFTAPSNFDHFHFASSRRGGRGGLDIYSGTPNVFADGMMRLVVATIDSASGHEVPSRVAIIDRRSGDTIALRSSLGEIEQLLPAGRAYDVVAVSEGRGTGRAIVEQGASGERVERTLRFGRELLASFDLSRYNVPYFVTGYYRPNTPENLEALFTLTRGPLAQASYIESFERGSERHRQYAGWAATVSSVLDTVAQVTRERVLDRIGERGYLEIVVTGYADPQPFTGTYVEDAVVTFEDRETGVTRIGRGDRIGNRELSGLRAWYAAKELDARLRSTSVAYALLADDGRIRFRAVAGGVDASGSGELAAKRRIQVDMELVGEGSAPIVDGTVTD